MGFEPTTSCVTGRRALQAAPRGRFKKGNATRRQVAQVGFEPTASLVLSQSGLPVAYRAKPKVPALEREWFSDRKIDRSTFQSESLQQRQWQPPQVHAFVE